MRPRIVLDASAALHAVLKLEHTESILDTLDETAVVLVPTLFAAEVANGLLKYVKAGTIQGDEATELFDEAMSQADHFVDDRELAQEALAMSAQHSHPVYDSLYVVLARRNACPVVTLDQRLARLLERLGVPFFLPGK